MATLINLLGRLDTSQVEITNQQLEGTLDDEPPYFVLCFLFSSRPIINESIFFFWLPGYEAVKLPEDVTLCGFTPLMLNSYEAHYTPRSSDMVSRFLFHLFFLLLLRPPQPQKNHCLSPELVNESLTFLIAPLFLFLCVHAVRRTYAHEAIGGKNPSTTFTCVCVMCLLLTTLLFSCLKKKERRERECVVGKKKKRSGLEEPSSGKSNETLTVTTTTLTKFISVRGKD